MSTSWYCMVNVTDIRRLDINICANLKSIPKFVSIGAQILRDNKLVSDLKTLKLILKEVETRCYVES